MRNRIARYVGVASVAVTVALVATTTGAIASPRATGAVSSTGTLHVLEVGVQWPGLDAATDTQDAADASFLNSIYGQLFELAAGNKVIDDEASGYTFSDNFQTVTIVLRKGLVFSNGDPFTAADVAWSINRDLEPKYGNIGDVNFPIKGQVTSSGTSDVVFHLTRPDSAFIDAFIDEAPNWTVDEKALNSAGESTYTQHPVGAGPFEVVSNSASSSLVLQKNPKYWDPGVPHLAGLDFTAIGSDQSAAAALESGEDQVAEMMATIPLLKQLPSQGLIVSTPPSTFTEFITLNEAKAPFNNIKAREAVEYATDTSALLKNLYYGAYPEVQDESAPGQQFYQQNNPNFRGYDLAKAKALVQQLGGLTVNLTTTTNTSYWINEVQAIATMWEAAGIKVNIQDYTLQQMLNITFSGTWQAIDSNWGGNINPSITDPQFFESTAAFSGVHDKSLDALFNQSASTASTTARAKIFTEINNLENQQADAVWMYSKAFFVVSSKSVVDNGGLGNDISVIRWENLGLSS
jgi:peptide/nickel transport system substrate-binding protein